MISSGLVVFFGFLFLAVKLPLRTKLMLLGYPLWVDLIVSAAAYVLHWGTFSGVMAAAVAGMAVSACTSLCRQLFGYIRGNVYVPGLFNIRKF